MRILLRRDGDNEYVWKEAIYKNEQYFIVTDGVELRVYDNNIAAVADHEKSGYVVCKACGEMVENTPEAIEAHYTSKENSKDCAKCQHLSFNNNIRPTRKLVDNGDGTYHVVDEYNSELYCRSNYYKKHMEDVDEVRECIFFACRRSGMRQSKDIFIAYPGVFDTAITVDVLTEKKYNLDGHNGSYFMYDLKSRGTIKACVNNSGIVECFQVSSNGDRVYFYYSEKYDKLFWCGGSYNSNYEEGRPSWFREVKFNAALTKIRALYKGAE